MQLCSAEGQPSREQVSNTFGPQRVIVFPFLQALLWFSAKQVLSLHSWQRSFAKASAKCFGEAGLPYWSRCSRLGEASGGGALVIILPMCKELGQ